MVCVDIDAACSIEHIQHVLNIGHRFTAGMCGLDGGIDGWLDMRHD